MTPSAEQTGSTDRKEIEIIVKELKEILSEITTIFEDTEPSVKNARSCRKPSSRRDELNE